MYRHEGRDATTVLQSQLRAALQRLDVVETRLAALEEVLTVPKTDEKPTKHA